MKRISKATSAISPPGTSQEMRKWAAEDALHTITRAEEIKKDSGLMRDVKRLAADKQKTLSAVVAAKPSARSRTKTK